MFDVNKIRNDFPMIKNHPNLVYFDSAATSFKPQAVIDRVVNFYENETSNIHRGDYDISFSVSKEYDETRTKVANFIGSKNPDTIVFTSGATASLNMIAYSYAFDNLKEGDVILSNYVEHASNVLPWFEIAKQKHLQIKYITLNDDGTFNLENFKNVIKDNDVKLVTITQVSNVLGYVYPIKEITEIAHLNGAKVVMDGAQSVPHMRINVEDLDVDFLAFSAHKMCGPSGVGVLYAKYELLKQMKPLFYGGGSNARFDKEMNVILKDAPDKFESGTPNIEGVLGLSAAIDYLTSIGMDNIEKYQEELMTYFYDKMSKLDNVVLYNKGSSAILSFNIKGVFAQDAASYLNSHHIAVRTGNHCAKLLNNQIGTNETVRASLYFYNTKEEIDYFVEVCKDITIEKCLDVLL